MSHGRLATVLYALRDYMRDQMGRDASWYVTPRTIDLRVEAPSPEAIERPAVYLRCVGFNDFRTETDRQIENGRALATIEALLISGDGADGEDSMVGLLDLAEDVVRVVVNEFTVRDGDGDPLVHFGAQTPEFTIDAEGTAILGFAAGIVTIQCDVSFPARTGV